MIIFLIKASNKSVNNTIKFPLAAFERRNDYNFDKPEILKVPEKLPCDGLAPYFQF
jgi:hypothetical protein